jgi:hypothetical protein
MSESIENRRRVRVYIKLIYDPLTSSEHAVLGTIILLLYQLNQMRFKVFGTS